MIRNGVLALLFLLAVSSVSTGQDQPGTLEEVNAEHARKLAGVEREHLAALIGLADRLDGPDASVAYEQAFSTAIANDLYREAEEAAQRVIAGDEPAADPRVRALANLVNLVAEADRGAFDEAQQSMEAIVRQGLARSPTRALDPSTALAVGEAYIQRLAAGGRYDIAKRACQLISQRAQDEGVRDHFAGRLVQLELVGKPAPPLAGTDVDGRPVDLASLKGKRVLVEFWATWCPPCSPLTHQFAQIYRAQPRESFEIVGVNLDASSGDDEAGVILANVRQYLAAHEATWPNLIGSSGPEGPATAYHVGEIPASFLVGPDGLIQHVELTPERLSTLLTPPPGG